MNKEKEKNVKTYIYAVIAVFAFILVAIGTSIAAYYLVNGNDDNAPIKVKTAYVNAMYEVHNSIDDDSVLPGWSDELKFSITNVSSEEDAIGDYSLFWEIEKNEIADDNFVYTLTGKSYKGKNEIGESDSNKLVNISSPRKVPSASVSIGNGVINTGVSHEYSLKVTLKESGTNQDKLRGKTFKAKLVAKGEPNV